MKPMTLAGKMVRAVAQRDPQAIQDAAAALRRTGWVGAGEVFQEAFTIAVRRRFPKDVDVRGLAGWIYRVVMQREARARVPVVESEALIRRALGEQEVDVSGISGSMLATIRFVIIEAVGVDLRWTVDDVDAFAAEAELRAQQRGARPAVG